MNCQNDGVICFECTELIKPLWYNMIKIEELNQAPIHVVGYNLPTEYSCKCCNRSLQSGGLYFNDIVEYDTFIRGALEAIASRISEEIYSCNNCTGGTIQRHVYMVNKDELQDLIDEEKYGTYIAALLEDNYLPEHMHEAVSQFLICQECRYGTPEYRFGNPGNNKFNKWDKIYYKDEVNEFWGSNIIQFASKYDISVNEHELDEFKEFLIKQPMLGLLNETGKKLYDAVKQSLISKEFIVLGKNETLFRGRVRHQDETMYSVDGLWSPPQGRASHGRYNPIGKSVLYCSDQKEVLAYELHPTNGQIIDIVKFETNYELKLFDMDNAFESFEGFIATQNVESNLLKQAYLITNFIGSCCEEVGYDGVKYSGVGNDKLNYSNYALFENEELRTVLGVVDDIEQYKVRVVYENSQYRQKSNRK
ncbi:MULTISPECIES: RES domain-containing protein [Paenibacillus]|uniref:Uncharacterized protein n=1 Tax=Paenibacillus lautus TaxID=1401 RepID=A0A1R1AU86_PAELA|nr:RES domain-containing protein [Paenibacillus lautus]OME89135.1 hypothetical protein BK123_27585 [Paenibacillus lautus]